MYQFKACAKLSSIERKFKNTTNPLKIQHVDYNVESNSDTENF